MFEELLSRLGRALGKHKIPYMIIGGQAVLLHGEPRLTKDIDITLGMGTDSLPEFLTVLKEIPVYPLPEDIYGFVGKTMVLPTLHKETGIRVDFIFSTTPYEGEAIKKAVKVLLGNEEIYFASAEDLIIHKIFAGRPRDLEDVKGILLKKPGLDITYIEKWLKEFDRVVPKGSFHRTFRKVMKGIRSHSSEGRI